MHQRARERVKEEKLASHALSETPQLGKCQQAHRVFQANPFKNEFLRAYANIYPPSSSEGVRRVFCREGDCFPRRFLRGYGSSSESLSWPGCLGQGWQPRGEPSLATALPPPHSVRRSAKGWTKNLRFFLLPPSLPPKKLHI